MATNKKDIVAGIINGKTVTNNREKLIHSLNIGLRVRWFTRLEMEIMAACDLGEKWERLAKAAPLIPELSIPHS